MEKALLIAEKPDLMRKIQDVYENHRTEIPYDIIFQSQRGHLVTLMLPDEIDETQKDWSWENLPIEPEKWEGGWKYKVIEEKKTGSFLTAKERFQQIDKELKSGKYDFVIHAGDPDQEGELLVNIVLQYAKNKLPVKRFWTNDLTEGHILDALKNLKDDDRDEMLVNLMAAAVGRQHSDYRFGMNISRAATLQMDGRVACGRVKTPILAIVCKREEEIKNFKAQTEYGVKCMYEKIGDNEFTGQLFSNDLIDEKEEKDEDKKQGIVWYKDKDAAQDKINELSHYSSAEVISYESEEVKTFAPKLFKLATLQIEAGKMGYNDATTLKIIQSLYEKKLLSYPRTDCEYLSSEEDFYGIISAVLNVPECEPFIRTQITKSAIEKVKHTKKWINDKELEKSGHSAIRPTTEAADMDALTKEERDIYTLVCKRFIAIFLKRITRII